MTRIEWSVILIIATIGGLLATGLVAVEHRTPAQRPALCATTNREI